MLEQITPVVITFNEAANIGRCLERLNWARRIVLVDSGSTDETLAIAKTFSNIEVHHRDFTSHSDQWRFAVQDTAIESDWVLRLDADYVVTDALLDELRALEPTADTVAFMISFQYAVEGRVLRSSLYPPNRILFQRGTETIVQNGHTERWSFAGHTGDLSGTIIHDDRKPLKQWIGSQANYARKEARYLLDQPSSDLSFVGRLRKAGWPAPFLVFVHVLFVKRLILDGRAGLTYALQRLVAEALIALYLADMRLGRGAKS